MIMLLKDELLTSERGDDGKWHARYPSGTQTLCGLTVSDAATIGRRWPPDCGVCAKAARAFDRIDGYSVPEHWRQAA